MARVHASPHQSLTPLGFVWFMGATLALASLPLLTVLGSPVMWGLLPFFGVVIWGLWTAISRNQRDASLSEVLTLWPDKVELVRREPRGPIRHWKANPYWVTIHLHENSGPVESYLTLKGAGREVEFGAFLSPGERRKLHKELNVLFASANAASNL